MDPVEFRNDIRLTFIKDLDASVGVTERKQVSIRWVYIHPLCGGISFQKIPS